MKKYITVAAITAVILISAAIILAIALGSSTEIQVTTGTSSTTATASAGTSATTSGAAGTPDNLCSQTGRGHVYEGGVCTVCGAEEPTSEDYLEFELMSDGTYSVAAKAKTLKKFPERLIIPAYYNSKPVTAIKTEGFSGEKAYNGFQGISNPKYVYIPETVNYIGRSAFADCDGISEIIINGEEVTFGERAFYDCDGLEKAVFNCDIKSNQWLKNMFYGCYKLETVEFNGKLTADKVGAGFLGTFKGCSSLTSVIFPEGTDFIGEHTFYECRSLETLDIPENAEINSKAFIGCEKLSFTLQESERYSITAHRIVDKSTKTLVWQRDDTPIPEDGSILNIAECAFYGNDKITEYKIPAVIESVGSYAFYHCKNLKSVVWESDCTEIPEYTFCGCEKLESFTLNGRIARIGNGAFYGCSAMESITVPDTVTEICDYAFRECDALEELTVPNGVGVLGKNVLYGCDALKRVYIPSTVRSIAKEALENCPNLWDIYYGGTIEEWHAIEKDDLDGVTMVHCTDGDIRLTVTE